MGRNIAALLGVVIMVSACAPSPRMASPVTQREQQMDCKRLHSELDSAKRYKDMSRQQDNFQFKYILIIPAIFSIWDMYKAEAAADERIASLENIIRQKGCGSQPMRSPYSDNTHAAPSTPSSSPYPTQIPGNSGVSSYPYPTPAQ